MKKIVALMFSFLLFSAHAFALPIGNPSEASLYLNGMWQQTNYCDPCFSWWDVFSLRIGFYGDYVFNRHLEADNDLVNDADVDTTRTFTNAGYVVLNFCDRIDLFSTLGATNMDQFTNGAVFFPVIGVNNAFTLDFRSAFSWSVGARGTLWECNCFALGVEGQYFRTNPDPDYLVDFDTGDFIYFDDIRSSFYREWQVGLGAAYRFAMSCPPVALIPYMGVKWSQAKLRTTLEHEEFGDSPRNEDFQSKKHWGYAVGCTLTLCDMVGVTVEGRWADEKAVHVRGQFRF